MKKELRRKKGEQLSLWHERLAKAYEGRTLTSGVLYDLLHEVSIQGYIDGSNVTTRILLNDN